MIVEILNVGVKNKGAELMLHAIMQKMRSQIPDIVFTVAPTKKRGHFPKSAILAMGLRPKIRSKKFEPIIDLVAANLPRAMRQKFAGVFNRDVDLVLDASGFAYGDQWGAAGTRRLAKSARNWQSMGIKFIMLPQAFGPFERSKDHDHVKSWAASADLVFCREQQSLDYLADLVGQSDNIKLYGDFTNLVNGVVPENFDASDKKVALVPNSQMLRKASDGAEYIPFMIRCARYLQEKDAKPFLLVHQTESDRALAQEISSAVGHIPIVQEADPLALKGILGLCDATIGSRFHGLVSALSQGVPSLATGWSHKYESLFRDYDFVDGLVEVTSSDNALYRKIDMITEDVSARALRTKLKERSRMLKQQSEEMWTLIFNTLT